MNSNGSQTVKGEITSKRATSKYNFETDITSNRKTFNRITLMEKITLKGHLKFILNVETKLLQSKFGKKFISIRFRHKIETYLCF
jgi:hypothetical protein